MSEFELPANLVAAAEAHDDPGSARHTWMADLPLIVDELAQRWSLVVGRPFQPGGVASWVVQHALLLAVAWPLLILAIFVPLAVHRWQRLSR